MRQVFSSPRLENVERVATLLKEHGIETRVTNGRSYRGSRRGSFSYRENPEGDVRPAVWVVTSDDQPKAREILREMGLLDSGRSPTSYLPTPHDVRGEDEIAARKRRGFRIKSALLFGIAIAMGVGFLSTRKPSTPAAAAPAAAEAAAAPVAKADTHIVETPSALAAMLIDVELRAREGSDACLAVDGKDPSARVLEQLKVDTKRVRPVSACGGADAMALMSIDVAEYRTDGWGTGTVRLVIGDQGPDGKRREDVRTLEVQRDDTVWKVKRVVL
ncbi:MAG: DUF2007 domain-containing protein [Xanthomonadaceae bacterium]|nr:DUF2007 domain-containing protein [Xanthomonadaceae bacterium]